MQQRGKKSTEALLTNVARLPTRLLEPPDVLTDEQAQVWREVVAEKPHDWFDSASARMLMTYCRLTSEHERVSGLLDAFDTEWTKEDEGLKRYHELIKIQDRLAARISQFMTKMRLTQQSRYRADAADVANRKGSGAKPWIRAAPLRED
jgi:hypothetical protein